MSVEEVETKSEAVGKPIFKLRGKDVQKGIKQTKRPENRSLQRSFRDAVRGTRL